MKKFRFAVPFLVVLNLLVLAGCTTSNQAALGVGVKPEAKAAATTETPPVSGAEASAALAGSASATPAEGAAASASAPAPAVAARSKVSFLPITGAPQGAVSSLSKALGTEAKRVNIAIAGANDTTAEYRVKGYMSALNEGSNTTVTFYWDVLDRSGNRLYRINGFEREDGSRSDPWAAVSSTTMKRIASRTMDGLSSWLSRKRS